ncbi:MAG: sulfotransferase family protein [Pseudomonadales bacterium]|nr:sulfotransferase family protein [Pseudomonadales bacterium]NIX09432.1 sulfotransferase family protein [Pseudomonadales bacterium]
MTLKVIGAGFGRTGTLSLKLALERLGLDKCYHMLEVVQNEGHAAAWLSAARGEFVDWDALFAGYQASVDWPSCNFWEAQLQHFPDAKVILTRRDPERWYDSVMNTIYPSSVARREMAEPETREHVDMVFEVIWDGLFDGRMDDKEHVIAVYEAHNQHVIDTLPPEKLLVFEASDGWQPLCDFLDLPVPEEPYPWVNSTEDFRARVAAAGSESRREG